MENIRNDIDELFGSQQITDAEGCYTSTPQNLFSDEDNVLLPRAYAVDEDRLAEFIELHLKIEEINEKLPKIEKLIEKIQARLKLAQEDFSKRMPFELYSAALTELVRLIGSKKQGKTGLKQKLFDERKRLSNERQKLVDLEGKAIWAAFYQEEEPADWLAAYLEKPVIEFYDPIDVDDQTERYDREVELDALAEAHVMEMRNGVGLVYEDQPRKKMDSDDWLFEKKMEVLKEQQNQEDAAFAALLQDIERF